MPNFRERLALSKQTKRRYGEVQSKKFNEVEGEEYYHVKNSIGSQLWKVRH
jgi:hypothetical protein